MATVDYDPLFDPLRGKVLGTVFQTGRNAPVIKAKNSSQGQQLKPFLAAKANLAHASTLWRGLLPIERTGWATVSVDFPTLDRYRNIVLSEPFQLFMRAIAPLPRSLQAALKVSRAAFTGTVPPAPEVVYTLGALQVISMDAPFDQNFNTAVFCSRPVQEGLSYAKPSFRQVGFFHDHAGVITPDLTPAYIDLFGPIPENALIFWVVKTWKTDTPELIDESTGVIPTTVPYIWISDLLGGFVFALGFTQVSEAYTGPACVITFVQRFFTDGLFDPSFLSVPRAGYFWNQAQNQSQSNLANFLQGSPPNASYANANWTGTNNYPMSSASAFTFVGVFSFPIATRTANLEFIRKGDTFGPNGGFRGFVNLDGSITFRLRRNAQISKTYAPVLNDNLLHMIAVTWDGSLNLSGIQLYFDSMSTPLVPVSTAGTTVSLGTYYTAVQYFWFGPSGLANGVRREMHIVDRALSPAELAQFKAFFYQNPAYAALV